RPQRRPGPSPTRILGRSLVYPIRAARGSTWILAKMVRAALAERLQGLISRAREPPIGVARFYRHFSRVAFLFSAGGKSQSWIAYRLCFGRFLNFTTTGVKTNLIPPNLTEDGF